MSVIYSFLTHPSWPFEYLHIRQHHKDKRPSSRIYGWSIARSFDLRVRTHLPRALQSTLISGIVMVFLFALSSSVSLLSPTWHWFVDELLRSTGTIPVSCGLLSDCRKQDYHALRYYLGVDSTNEYVNFSFLSYICLLHVLQLLLLWLSIGLWRLARPRGILWCKRCTKLFSAYFWAGLSWFQSN